MVKDLRERDFENVMFENAQLQNKLENLENVFIGSAVQRGNNNQSNSNGAKSKNADGIK